MRMNDRLNSKQMKQLDSMRKASADDETEEEKKYKKEKELRELMGEFSPTYERRNGAIKRKR